MKNPKFINKGIYHIFGRGVEKRKIFLDKNDHLRFLEGLISFNDTSPAESISNKNRQANLAALSAEVEPPLIERDPYVEIGAFVLMPNHYHLILRQIREGGISNFMQKLGTGYTMYFNEKYRRVGSLLQGRFRAVEIEKNNQLLYLPYYLHANPIEILKRDWKNKKIKNYKKTVHFLKEYKWSSLNNFISDKEACFHILSDNLVKLLKASDKSYSKEFFFWIKEHNISKIDDLLLD